MVLLLGVLLAPAPVRGEGIYGTVQLQYQRAEDNVISIGPNGERRTNRAASERFLRTFDLHHQDYLRPDWLLDSNLRFSAMSVLGRNDATRTPTGSLRLVNPFVQVTAMHTPSSVRSTVFERTGVSADSTTRGSATSRTQQSSINGHVALPRLPQIDLSWTRSRRERVAAAVGEANISRNARMTFDREHYSVYGSIGDQRQKSDLHVSPANVQQSMTAGGMYRVAPSRNVSMYTQYDIGTSRGWIGGVKRPNSVNQSGSASGDWHPAPKFNTSANYQWRRVDTGSSNSQVQDDHDAALMARYAFARTSTLLAGGGVRTTRVLQRVELQKYVTAIASASGSVRRGWDANSSVSHTTTWDPQIGAYGTETVAGSTRALLGHKAQVDGSIQMAASGDSGSAAQRYSTSWATRMQATPLRALTLALSMRSLRVGPGLLRPSGVTRGLGGDAQWRPTQMMELVGSYSTTRQLPNQTQRSTTRSLTAKIQAGPHWQWFGTWTRSDQGAVTVSGGTNVRRELVSGRVQWEPVRRFASSATLSVQEPGQAQELRQVDVALTWSFGR